MRFTLRAHESRMVNAFGRETVSSLFAMALNALLAGTEFLREDGNKLLFQQRGGQEECRADRKKEENETGETQ